MALGDIINFNYKAPPKLSVTPVVSDANAIKQGGPFTSSIIINLDYQ